MKLPQLALFLGIFQTATIAQTALDEESPWPRVRSTNGNTVTLHLPQVESWTSNSFRARSAVEVKLAKSSSEQVGVVWLEAHGRVDRDKRIVTLDKIEVARGRFPGAMDNGSNALAAVREVVPQGVRTVSLDYLVTALGFERAAARQGPRGIKHDPPDIIWVTNRTVLVIIDGQPVLRPMRESTLERVMNTPALMVRHPASGQFYLAGGGLWYSSGTALGPWSLAQEPPPEIKAISPPSEAQAPTPGVDTLPRIIVSTKPAELVYTHGLPDFRPIRGTSLQYAADSDNQLFFDYAERKAYVLLSGRWFRADSLRGPWSYISPHDLPSDFTRIPPGTAQGVVLASVPGTPQAELALLANSVPTVATVSRSQATIQLTYDGEPKFKPIEGTQMAYAINAQLPVIKSGESYYALDNGVWFVGTAATGPWKVATEVPEEIYTIPPSSPVYYATFARIYDSDEDQVEVGYTQGYQGTYEDDGTVVYGTGYDYEPYYGDYYYYGWGWTWGYGYIYAPWYQWWFWRNWWNPPSGLRAALIDNVYDRWQGRRGILNYDRPPGLAPLAPKAPLAAKAPLAPKAGYAGYPALYGRFSSESRPAELSPPANTLALNPYTRPQAPVRPGEIPKGAQLLTTIQQAPGGGRDLYASPDGNVYRRNNDGWYRRDTGGGWKFYAPTQGTIQGDQAGSGRPAQLANAGVYRPTAAQAGALADRRDAGIRVPDEAREARAQEVAALERQYYARSLATMRAQNFRSYNVNPGVRAGGGRR